MGHYAMDQRAQSAAEMAIVGGADSSIAGGVSAQEEACHKLVADAWERPPQTAPVSNEPKRVMDDLEKIGGANLDEKETLEQVKGIFKLPESAGNDAVDREINKLSQKMVREALGLCPGASDADVMKQMQEMMIHNNLKLVGPQELDKSFGLPAGASREQIREAAGRLILQQQGLDGKFSKLDEKAAPEASRNYYEFVGNQIKARLRLNF